jgi:major intracellular serine protease
MILPYYRNGEILIRLHDSVLPSGLDAVIGNYPQPVREMLTGLMAPGIGMTNLEVLWPIGLRPIPGLTPAIVAAAPLPVRTLLDMLQKAPLPTSNWNFGELQFSEQLQKDARLRLLARVVPGREDAALSHLRQPQYRSIVKFAERIPRRVFPRTAPPSPGPSKGNPIVSSTASPVWGHVWVNKPKEWNSYALENIAVIDSGCDITHPALQNRVIHADAASETDPSGHGTFVCGELVGSQTPRQPNAEEDLPEGLLPKSKVWVKSVRDSDDENGFTVSERQYLQMLYLLSHPGEQLRVKYRIPGGIKVINLSLGDNELSTAAAQGEVTQFLEESSCIADLETAGIVVVACAHNQTGVYSVTNYQKTHIVYYPALLNTVISVGALEPTGELWSGSRRCFPLGFTSPKTEAVDLCAPGVEILSSSSNQRFAKRDKGTSFAAPYVTAAVAVLCQANKTAQPQDIRNLLFAAAKKTQSMNQVGYGRGTLDCSKIKLPLVRVPITSGGTLASAGSVSLQGSIAHFTVPEE